MSKSASNLAGCARTEFLPTPLAELAELFATALLRLDESYRELRGSATSCLEDVGDTALHCPRVNRTTETESCG